MTATPTPGDLSARLPELPFPDHVDAFGDNSYNADQMRDYAIAALSALPADGGKDESLIDLILRLEQGAQDDYEEGIRSGNSEQSNDAAGRLSVINAIGRKVGCLVDTTPQPSAAEGVRGEVVCNACGYPEWVCDAIACGKIKQGSTFVADESTDAAECSGCSKALTGLCAVCAARLETSTDAAVGAQGDGIVAAIDRMGAAVLAENLPAFKVAYAEARRLATPAAGKGFEKWWHENCDKFDRGRDLAIAAWQAASSGKGVDDANNRACIRFVADDGSTHASPEAADKHNALTRQPVAGDGDADFELWQDGEFVAGSSGPRAEAWREILHYAAQYEQDGAVTIMEVIRRPLSAPAATPTDGGEG